MVQATRNLHFLFTTAETESHVFSQDSYEVRLMSPFYRCQNQGSEINSFAQGHRAMNHGNKVSNLGGYLSVPSTQKCLQNEEMNTDSRRALKEAPCPLCVSEAWFVSWRGPGPICSFQRGEAEKWFLGQRHRHCQGLGLLVIPCVMIPTFTKQLRKNILRVKQRKVQACRCKLGKKREVSAPGGPPGHSGQVTPTPLLEPHWFSMGSHSPFLLVNPSDILTQWLDSRGCADTLACRIRDCSLAIQQWLDSQDGLIVHPWGK